MQIRSRPIALASLCGVLTTTSVACTDQGTRRELTAPHVPLVADVAFTPNCQGEPVYPQQSDANPYGINVNALSYDTRLGDWLADTTYSNIATALRKAGTGWVRVSFDWDYTQPDAPPAPIQWSRADATMRRADCRGLNVVGNLAYTPAWARQRSSSLDKTYLPDHLSDWAAYVNAVVQRYPEVRYWEIWNEPNTASFFNGQNGSTIRPGGSEAQAQLIADYAQLVAAAAPYIRQPTDGRGARFLLAPVVAATGDNVPGSDASSWIAGLFTTPNPNQGANVDVVDVHLYSDSAGISGFMRNLANSAPSWRWPIWLTEAGLPGLPDVNSEAANLQGVMTAMSSGTVQSWWKKTFYWHGFIDLPGDNRGILGGAGQGAIYGRPAFYALENLVNPPAGVSIYGPGDVYPRTSINLTTTQTGGHADQYYYAWDLLCTGVNDGCDNTYHPYRGGWGMTSITAGVDAGMTKMVMRVQLRDTPTTPPGSLAVAAGAATALYAPVVHNSPPPGCGGKLIC